MSQKRMFSKKITDSGEFLKMPLTTQCLYFHLNLHADDDGVVDNIKTIMRMIGANDDDVNILLAKKFLLIVENEIVVIKDWWIHNTILKDRYEESLYKEKLDTIYSVDNHKQYTRTDNNMLTNSYQNDNEKITNSYQNVNSNKNSIDKINIDKYNKERDKGAKAPSFKPPTAEEIAEYCKERGNNVDPKAFYDFYESKGWMIGKNKMKDWKAAVRTWEQRQIKKTTNQAKKQISREEYNKMFSEMAEKTVLKQTEMAIKDTS